MKYTASIHLPFSRSFLLSTLLLVSLLHFSFLVLSRCDDYEFIGLKPLRNREEIVSVGISVVPGVDSIIQKFFWTMCFSIFVVGKNFSFVFGWGELAILYCAHVLLVLVSLVVRTTTVSTVGSVEVLLKGALLGKLLPAEIASHHQFRSSSYFVPPTHCNYVVLTHKISTKRERLVKVLAICSELV